MKFDTQIRILLLMLACFASLVATSIGADYPNTVLSQGPVGYWRLGETTQPPTLAAVNSGSLSSAADGAMSGNPARGRPGALSGATNTAYGFSNPGWVVTYVGTLVDVAYRPDFNPNGPFSFELWAKPSSMPTDLFSPLCSLDASQNGGNSREGYLLYADGTTSKWNFRMGGFSGYAATLTGGTLTPGAWHHVAGVFNGTTAFLYVNG